MNKRDKQLLVIIIALVMMLLVVVVGVLIYSGTQEEKLDKDQQGGQVDITDNNKNDESEKENENDPFEQNPDVLTEGVIIETPCGTVFYPMEWEDYLVVENVKENGGESICFYAQIEGKEKTPLFNLNFGIAKGSLIGSAKAGEKTVEVYFEVFEPEFFGSWKEEEINIIYSMQEGMNNIFAQLNIDSGKNEAIVPSEEKSEIETAFGTIHFPGEWEEYLYTEIEEGEEYIVKFFAKIPGKGNIALFDICFGKKSESSFGEVIGIDGKKAWVNVIIHDFIPGNDWSSDESNIVYGMQEAFNDIIDDIIL